jgi:hypothetical protein
LRDPAQRVGPRPLAGRPHAHDRRAWAQWLPPGGRHAVPSGHRGGSEGRRARSMRAPRRRPLACSPWIARSERAMERHGAPLAVGGRAASAAAPRCTPGHVVAERGLAKGRALGGAWAPAVPHGASPPALPVARRSDAAPNGRIETPPTPPRAGACRRGACVISSRVRFSMVRVAVGFRIPLISEIH